MFANSFRQFLFVGGYAELPAMSLSENWVVGEGRKMLLYVLNERRDLRLGGANIHNFSLEKEKKLGCYWPKVHVPYASKGQNSNHLSLE